MTETEKIKIVIDFIKEFGTGYVSSGSMVYDFDKYNVSINSEYTGSFQDRTNMREHFFISFGRFIDDHTKQKYIGEIDRLYGLVREANSAFIF